MGVEVREMREAERGAATACDHAAMQTFRDAGIDLPDDAQEVAGDLVLVAVVDDEVGGVACVDRHDGAWHLAEMAVHPRVQRRGAGTALLLDVVRRAGAAGAREVTLTTFRDVPFNGPFYVRHGFEVVDEAIRPWLVAAREHERAEGIEVLPRVAMRRPLP